MDWRDQGKLGSRQAALTVKQPWQLLSKHLGEYCGNVVVFVMCWREYSSLLCLQCEKYPHKECSRHVGNSYRTVPDTPAVYSGLPEYRAVAVGVCVCVQHCMPCQGPTHLPS